MLMVNGDGQAVTGTVLSGIFNRVTFQSRVRRYETKEFIAIMGSFAMLVVGFFSMLALRCRDVLCTRSTFVNGTVGRNNSNHKGDPSQ